MKARVAGPELADALGQIARAVNLSRVHMPWLAGVLVTADVDTVTVEATDLQVRISVILDADVGEPGQVLITGRKFVDIAKALPAAAVNLTLADDQVTVATKGSRYRLRTIPVDDYPVNVLNDDADRSGNLPAVVVAASLFGVLPGASNDNARPILQSVHMVAADGRLLFETTDSYRMHRRVVPFDGDEFTALIPSTAADNIARLADKAEGDIKLAASERHLVVETGGVRYATAFVVGEFPKFTQLMPTTFQRTVTADADTLTAAVKQAQAADSTAKPVIRIEATTDGLILSAGSGEVAQGEVEAAAELDGEPLLFGVNARYLLDALSSTNADQVMVQLNDELKPMLVRPTAGDDDRPLVLLMPVRI